MPQNPLVVVAAAKHLAANRKSLELNISYIFDIKNLQNISTNLDFGVNTKDLKEFSFEDIARIFIENIFLIDLEQDNDPHATDLVKYCQIFDKTISSDELIIQNLPKLIQGIESGDSQQSIFKFFAKNKMHLFHRLSENLRSYKPLVIEFVKENGMALQHVPKALRDENDVVMNALAQNSAALQYVSDGLRTDGEFFVAAMALNSLVAQGDHDGFWYDGNAS
jgi:hypothetical protein